MMILSDQMPSFQDILRRSAPSSPTPTGRSFSSPASAWTAVMENARRCGKPNRPAARQDSGMTTAFFSILSPRGSTFRRTGVPRTDPPPPRGPDGAAARAM